MNYWQSCVLHWNVFFLCVCVFFTTQVLWVYHQASLAGTVRLSRVQGRRIDEGSGRGCRVSRHSLQSLPRASRAVIRVPLFFSLYLVEF